MDVEEESLDVLVIPGIGETNVTSPVISVSPVVFVLMEAFIFLAISLISI